MTLLDPPNPRWITMALDAAGLWGPEVDAALKVPEPWVDQWEAGTRVPSPAEVERLAELTGFPVEFFHRDDPEPVGPMWICQRSGRGKGCRMVDDRPADDPTRIDVPEGALF